jgi:hypothetical protein
VNRKQILTINGICADNRYHIIVHISIDLTFDSFKYDRATRFLKLENCGDVAIDLSFEKIEAQSTATTTSFFFDKFPFRLIPHEVLEMPFHFYPTQTGLFCEKWKLNCVPLFAYDHQIVINLIGICERKHKIEDKVAKLEAEITRKAAQFSICQEIKSIIDLSIPECSEEDRLSSILIDPIEKKFNAMNPKLTYCPSIVGLMSQLHHQINGSDQWNYDVDALYGHIMNIHDDDELQKELYRQFNDAYGKLLTAQKQSECDDKIVKIAMIKCLFGQFFDHFETEMEANVDDHLNSIAKIFATTINKMISILES